MEFERGKDPKKAMRLGKTVLDDLKEHPICKPMNNPWENVKDPRDPNLQVWINPNNQTCFNSGWCSEKDLRDWMEGKGILVKGDTPEEKKKYWDYAKLEASDNNHIVWSILYHWRWFKKFDSDYNPHSHKKTNSYRLSTIERPIIIPKKVKDDRINKANEEEVIIKMFFPYINEILSDLEYLEWSNIFHKYEKEFYGVKRTLYCLGIGYFAACNTPEEISNLSWVTSLVQAKAYWIHLQKNGSELPDFEWLSNKIYERD